MTGGIKEYAARNERLVEFARKSTGYSHFCMLCALEGFEPWSPGMYGLYTGCVRDENGGFDVWKAMAE